MEAFHRSDAFLRAARAAARKGGYDPKKLTLAEDGRHKLTYDSPEGVKHFGLRGYGDYLWYSRTDPELAVKKRHVFRTSHGALSRKRGLGRYSPNELAMHILWPM